MTAEFHGLRTEQLDETDRQIVRYLQEDGRRSVAAIARDLGLSHAWTRKRVQRLLESRIVQIGAITAPALHGYSRMSFIGIRTDRRIEEVAAAVAEIHEAYYVVICAGFVDVVAEIMCRDDAHMVELIARIRSIEGVVETQALPFADLVKWRYAPDFVDGAADGGGALAATGLSIDTEDDSDTGNSSKASR